MLARTCLNIEAISSGFASIKAQSSAKPSPSTIFPTSNDIPIPAPNAASRFANC